MRKFCSSTFAWVLPAGTIVLALAACSAAARQPAGAGTAPQQGTGKDAAPPAPLPWSRGQTFATLDAYLAYLEQYNGPIDLPWWREISPGVYEKVMRMPEARPETATRAELERRWGFAPAR